MKTRSLTDKRVSILLIATLLSSYTFISLTKQCFSSAMAFIVDEGRMSKSQVGTVVAVFYLVYGVLQIVGGALTDKWKPERFITVGYLGAGLCNLAVYLCEQYRFCDFYSFVLIVWVLNACSQFAVWPATFKMLSSMIREEQRTNALLLAAFTNPLGTVLNFAVAALVPKWQTQFLLSAIGLVAFALFWELYFRDVKRHLTEIEMPVPSSGTPSGEGKPTPHTLGLFLYSGTVFLLVVVFVRGVLDNGLRTLIATMINESYNSVTPTVATALTVIILVVGTIAPLLARLVYPKYIKNEMAVFVWFMAMPLPFVCLMLLLGRVHYVLIVVFTSMIVLATSAASLFTSYIAVRFDKWGKGATVAGAFNAMSALGIVVSNFVFTRVAEWYNWITIIKIWIVLLLISYMVFLIAIPMWRRFFKQ